MGQEAYVADVVKEDRSTTVAVTQKGDSNDKRLELIIAEELVGVEVAEEIGFPAFSALQQRCTKSQELLIRCLDILGSVLALLVSLPLMGVISLFIKIFSPGSVLYKQDRIGKNGKVFTLYKFRTMINNAEDQTGPVLAAKEDSRVTSIGRVLRRTRLDELPQLFNVLVGNMSLVGPRPERPYFVNRHNSLQGMRLSVKPGITGLAQIRSFYDLKPRHKAKYDYLYIQRRSLLLNMYILLKTLPVIFSKKGW